MDFKQHDFGSFWAIRMFTLAVLSQKNMYGFFYRSCLAQNTRFWHRHGRIRQSDRRISWEVWIEHPFQTLLTLKLISEEYVHWIYKSEQWYIAPSQHNHNPDSKVHGANVGPTWVLSAPDGPHFGPTNLVIRDSNQYRKRQCIISICDLWDLCSRLIWSSCWGVYRKITHR